MKVPKTTGYPMKVHEILWYSMKVPKPLKLYNWKVHSKCLNPKCLNSLYLTPKSLNLRKFNLKIKSPMKRNMKRLLECDTVQLIFYREGWKGIKAFTSMHTSGRKASKIYGFVREIIKLKGDTIEESRIGNLPLWMILWRRKDKHIFFIAIRKKSKPGG